MGLVSPISAFPRRLQVPHHLQVQRKGIVTLLVQPKHQRPPVKGGRYEPVVRIKRSGAFVQRVNEHGSYAGVFRYTLTAACGVLKQCCSQPKAVKLY